MISRHRVRVAVSYVALAAGSVACGRLLDREPELATRGDFWCEAPVPHVPQPEQAWSRVPGKAAVVAMPPERASQHAMQFLIENLSDATLMFDRRAVSLAAPSGVVLGPEGGARRCTLKPGATCDVGVAFDVDDLPPAARVEVRFDDAVLVDGRHVGLAPLLFDLK